MTCTVQGDKNFEYCLWQIISRQSFSISLRACARVLYQQKGGTGGGWWCHMQSAVHMVAAKLGCKRAMVGTGWAHSHPGCVNRLRERYSHLVGVHFWQGRLLGFRMGICQMRIKKRLGLINQKFNCHGIAQFLVSCSWSSLRYLRYSTSDARHQLSIANVACFHF